eukprot:4438057-Pyramimonas_sp.AAC.1
MPTKLGRYRGPGSPQDGSRRPQDDPGRLQGGRYRPSSVGIGAPDRPRTAREAPATAHEGPMMADADQTWS